MPTMTKTRLADGIFLVRFDTQYALASTFLRVQEHYESSRFRNRVFSLEQFMDWYAARFGAFTYYEDWSGFNVPSKAFAPFYEGRFDPLLRKEARLLGLFRHEAAPFYVIGIASDADLEHELAHALFFMRPAYRRAVRAAVRGHDTSALEARLAAMGYHRGVLADEVHAYLVAPPAGARPLARGLASLQRQLRTIYRRHAGELSIPAPERAVPARRRRARRPR
jgi:hypothetical protein